VLSNFPYHVSVISSGELLSAMRAEIAACANVDVVAVSIRPETQRVLNQDTIKYLCSIGKS
jgi:hypothetical protein